MKPVQRIFNILAKEQKSMKVEFASIQEVSSVTDEVLKGVAKMDAALAPANKAVQEFEKLAREYDRARNVVRNAYNDLDSIYLEATKPTMKLDTLTKDLDKAVSELGIQEPKELVEGFRAQTESWNAAERCTDLLNEIEDVLKRYNESL